MTEVFIGQDDDGWRARRNKRTVSLNDTVNLPSAGHSRLKTDRRRFVLFVVIGVLTRDAGFGLQHSQAASGDVRSSERHRIPEEWMDAWMSSPNRGGETPLYMGRFKDPMYFITQPVTWTPNPGQSGYASVTVPVGFVTDLASIPQVFWDLLRPDGEYTYAAIIHDYLYWTQGRSRETSDMIFKLAMQDFKINASTIEIVYRAVRLGGQRGWDNNRKLKQEGEKRVLRTFPDDPGKTWQEWRNVKGVFAEQ